jgi:hypothetical protein
MWTVVITDERAGVIAASRRAFDSEPAAVEQALDSARMLRTLPPEWQGNAGNWPERLRRLMIIWASVPTTWEDAPALRRRSFLFCEAHFFCSRLPAVLPYFFA